jgi:hypothetical protein
VATGANVVADATAGLVVTVVAALVVTVKPEVDGEAEALPHGATVTVAHDAVSRFLIRPNSL